MELPLLLPPDEETRLRTWAAQQGKAIEQDTSEFYRIYGQRSGWHAFFMLLGKTLQLLRPVMDEAAKRNLSGGRSFLMLIQAMIALHHVNGGRPYSPAELSVRSPLQDALTLYDLRIVSLEIASRIADVSQSSFIKALGEAGISVFQYGVDEALDDAKTIGAAA